MASTLRAVEPEAHLLAAALALDDLLARLAGLNEPELAGILDDFDAAEPRCLCGCPARLHTRATRAAFREDLERRARHYGCTRCRECVAFIGQRFSLPPAESLDRSGPRRRGEGRWCGTKKGAAVAEEPEGVAAWRALGRWALPRS